MCGGKRVIGMWQLVSDAENGTRGRPKDFRVATPNNWFSLNLDPRSMQRSITRLVEARVAPGPEFEGARRELTEVLRNVAADAAEQGAVHAFMLSDVIAGRPVSASLTCTLTTTAEEPDLEDVSRQLRHAAKGRLRGAEVTVIDLPAGSAVRSRERRIDDVPEPIARRVEVESLQYFVRVPDTNALLLLSFSTPNLPIADALVELFDAIAGSLEWEY